MTIIVCSTIVFFPEQKVVPVRIEVTPVNPDLPHGYEVVSPGGERARVNEERVGVVLPPVTTIPQLDCLGS